MDAVFTARASEGRLAFRMRGAECRAWAAAGVAIYGPPGARVTHLFPERETRSVIPPPDSLTIVPLDEAPRVLRDFCEFLIQHGPADGGFSYAGSWYQNAYPLRTLLAGSRLLDEPRWSDAAIAVIDRFVDAQRPDGRWLSNYFGRPGCHLSAGNDTTSSNLADIGSMTLTVALAVPFVDPARRAIYLAALRNYADNVVLPVQRSDGSFPNLRYLGRTYNYPYSVATATQAASLAVLGALTGERRYGDAAERAGLWLADAINDEGRVRIHPHDSEAVKVVQPTAFGDVFYLIEVLTWVERYAPRREAQTTIRKALDRYFRGSGGLFSVTRHGYWWTPRTLWSDSKMGGILYPLIQHSGPRFNADTKTLLTLGLSWLADAGLSQRMGVRAPPAGLTGDFGLVATGFAGISVAAMIDPAILRPK